MCKMEVTCYSIPYVLTFTFAGCVHMAEPLATSLQFLSTLGLAYAFAARNRKHVSAANRVAEFFCSPKPMVGSTPWTSYVEIKTSNQKYRIGRSFLLFLCNVLYC